MIDLDDTSAIAKVDPDDFLGDVEAFPDQVREALDIGQGVDLPDLRPPSSVAVLGMGGSGISGDVLGVFLGPRSPVPSATVKGYELPAWVGEDTLVFATSYSGNTEETLTSYEQAVERGASVVAVTTGGELADRAELDGFPVVRIPPGLVPRAAMGYLAVPLIAVLGRIVGESYAAKVEELLPMLDEGSGSLGRKVPASENPAKRLAAKLVARIPFIYGTSGAGEVAAYRWKCQFNECSKVPAHHHSFPELNHNEVVGFKELTELTSSSVALVVLRRAGDHPRNDKRIDITLPLIEDEFALVEKVRSEAKGELASLFDLVYFGDFVATYLAIAQGVDPSPTEIISRVKSALAT